MTDRQRIFIRSTQVTIDCCDANPVALALVPVMELRLAKVKLLLQDFLDADQLLLTGVKGITESKKEWRERLETETEFGYGALESYGIEIDDEQLKEFARYTAWELSKMNGEELLEVGKNLVEKLALMPAAALLEQGFEASDLTSLQTVLTEFDTWLNAPETGIKLRTTRVEDRNEKFRLLVHFMKGPMDAAAKVFKKKDMGFYRLYKTCRKLHKEGSRKRTAEEADLVN